MVATTNKVSSFNGPRRQQDHLHIYHRSLINHWFLFPPGLLLITLPETNIAPENGWLEDVFPMEDGWKITSFFMCYVSFRECKTWWNPVEVFVSCCGWWFSYVLVVGDGVFFGSCHHISAGHGAKIFLIRSLGDSINFLMGSWKAPLALVVSNKVDLLVEMIQLVKLYSSRPHTSFGPPKCSLVKGSPLISGKSRLVKYYNLARSRGASIFEWAGSTIT